MEGLLVQAWPLHCHCVVFLSKTLYPLLNIGSTKEDPSQHDWKIVDNQTKQKDLWAGFWEIHFLIWKYNLFKNSEHDQEIPQLQTADKPMAPRGRATHTTINSACCVILHNFFFFFSKFFFFFKIFFQTIRVAKGLDPDQEWRSLGPDLGPICWQRLSADDKIRRLH